MPEDPGKPQPSWVYLHFPFCSSLCTYCDFAVVIGRGHKRRSYEKALLSEIRFRPPAGPLAGVYFGGGTPSLFSLEGLREVLRILDELCGFSPDAEISLEANPETLDPEKISALRSLGVNRLSFGVQAFDPQALRVLGRHGRQGEHFEKCWAAARAAGFLQLNIDLMFGFPGQTFSDWRETLERAVAFQPDHLSCYALQVEEGTFLARKITSGGWKLPAEEETAQMYEFAQVFLEEHGLRQVEVSNFARDGIGCRYHQAVWQGEDYEGFGLSAVATVGLRRRRNTCDLETYLERVHRGADPLEEVEKLSPLLRRFEKIFLGLRTARGVERREWEDYLRDAGLEAGEAFHFFQEKGWLKQGGGRLFLRGAGFLLLNSLAGAWFPLEEALRREERSVSVDKYGASSHD